MTEDQIKHMTQRFLGWRLPEAFNPDNGITFEPIGNVGTPHAYHRDVSGTNLFDYTQAEAMVRYMVEGLPEPKRGIVRRFRDAITGHYVSRDYARQNPATTVGERQS